MNSQLSRTSSRLGPTKNFLFRRIQRLSLIDINDNRIEQDAWGPVGLTLLHEPSEPLIDFIFVHGLGGGSRKTWSKSENPAHFWPKEWLPTEPRLKNVRIHTFGYNATWKEQAASPLTLHDFGQALLTDVQNSPLLGRDDVNTPIVLIGHSMGGLVVKKMLLLAKQDPSHTGIATRIRALFFLATPHRGSNLANLLSNLLRFAIGHGSKAYIDSIASYSEAIQAINDQFRHVYQDIQLHSFFETVPTSLGIIVEKTSAVLELPGEKISHLNADHSQVCKFDAPSDSNYCRLRDAFISTIASIEKTHLSSRIHRRQDELGKLYRYLGLEERPGIDFANAVDRRTEGSCTWLTEKPNFHLWLDDLEDSPRYYWLRGEPASGKSTVAGHVIQYLENCNRDCSYFFFKHLNSGKSTVAELLRSLAWQMASTNTSVREKILEMCDTGVTIDMKDERSIWRTVFAARILLVELQQPQYWVVDALDECANSKALFPLLSKIEKKVRLRVFLTSRPSLVFERSFSQENIPRIAEAITQDVSLIDIKLFLDEHAPYFLVESEEERQQLVDTILKTSNGNFLWTDLIVKNIEEARSIEQMYAILGSVPDEVNELYRHIFRNIMATPNDAVIAQAILRWTLCSLRPLLVDELKDALRLDIGENLNQLEKTVGSICGNLVRVDGESRVLAAHQTVREFFFREGGDSEFRMNKEKEHARIIEICLSYLCGDEMKSPRFRRANSSGVQKATRRSPFAAYAITYFSHHLSHATSSYGAHLIALDKFFMNNSLAWIDAVARTQDLNPLTQTAKNLKAYLERRAKYEGSLGLEFQNVSTWANELSYVVAQFGKTLVANPQAIFHLIPAVCPRKSIIYRTFKSHPRALQAVGLGNDEWDERLCCIVIPETQILSVACQDNKFALGTSNGKVYIYLETTLQEMAQLSHNEPVRRLRFATTNDYLASCGRRKFNFWNTSTGQLLWSIPMQDEILALAFSEDDKILYLATKGNYTIILGVLLGREIERFKFCDWDEDEKQEHKYRRPPTHIDFLVGLNIMGVAYRQRPVSFWTLTLEDHQFVGQFHLSKNVYPEPLITAFAFNPNQDICLAAVSNHDGFVYVFDPDIQKTLATGDAKASVLAPSPDGTALVAGGGDGSLRLYDFETMKLLHQSFIHQQAIRSIVFNSSGSRFFEIRGNYCNIWEPSALVRATNLEDDSSVAFSDQISQVPEISSSRTCDDVQAIVTIVAHDENDFVFCGREDGSVAAYATKTGKLAQELFVHSQNVAVDFLEWNHSRKLLACANRSGHFTVRKLTRAVPKLFDIGQPILDQGCSSVISQILMSNDGTNLLVSTADSDVLWELTALSVVRIYKYTKARKTWKWAKHPDTDRLLLFEDSCMRIYKWAALEELSNADGIDLGMMGSPITNVVFPSQSRNGCLIASKAPVSGQSLSFQLWPAKIFSPETEVVPLESSYADIAKDLKAVFGTFKSWLIYLQHGGWVCSVNLDTAANDKFYLKHFVIPLHWHGTTVNPMAVTQKGCIIMAVKEELVVFHNGLDFEERVPF